MKSKEPLWTRQQLEDLVHVLARDSNKVVFREPEPRAWRAFRHYGMGGIEMYRYTGSGLDGIFLKNGYTIVEPPYGQGVRIENVDGLHRAIAAEILRQRTPMTGHQFRFLRKEQDLIQEEAAAIFRVDVQTIANWEKRGPQEIPGPPDIGMRAFYSAYIHANFGPIKFELNLKPNETTSFEIDDSNWVESEPVAA